MIYMVSFSSSSMGNYPGLGFFLAQLCLDTQDRGKIGKNVSFASSSIPRKTMVEMLYGAPQWEIPQDWFVSCSIMSTYSTTMSKETFPLLDPQLQENNGGYALSFSSMGDSPSFVSFFLNCVYKLHHNDQ